MARKAKRNYRTGVYRLLYTYSNTNYFDLVLTHAIDGDPNGNGLNADFVFAQHINWEQLKQEIRKNKITRAIWYGRDEDDYVTPKDVLSGKNCGVIFIDENIW